MKNVIFALITVAVALLSVVVYSFVFDKAPELSVYEQQITSLESELTKLKAELDNSSGSASLLDEQLNKAYADMDKYKDKIASMEETISALNAANSGTASELERLNNALAAEKKLLETKSNEYDALIKAQNGTYTTVLTTFSTKFNASDTARFTNIEVATRCISGRIIMPGEEFSFMDIVGECTEAKGYVESKVFFKGELTQGLGGGVCQVSTTLFNTALLANLKISERHGHSMKVSYVTPGRDATYNYGSMDLKFVNTYKAPIKIVGEAKNGVLTFSILCEINACRLPEVAISVTGINANSFKTTRVVDGVMNYFTNTTYK